jgi:hypothetical protein
MDWTTIAIGVVLEAIGDSKKSDKVKRAIAKVYAKIHMAAQMDQTLASYIDAQLEREATKK